MVTPNELRQMLDDQHEWLLVHENGRSFALASHEISLESNEQGSSISFLDDQGLRSRPLNGCLLDGFDLQIVIGDPESETTESIRLVPRTPAADLTAEIELARLKRANEIAGIILEMNPTARLTRVALNAENGRLAQITFDLPDKTSVAAVAEVTGALTVESIFTSSMLWLDKLGLRKNHPIFDVWIICDERQAKNAQKIHTLLTDRWKAKIKVHEINRKEDPPRLKELPKRPFGALWREKAPKLSLPTDPSTSRTGEAIRSLAPDKIDIVYSRNGETLRFLGLPFARVRTVLDQETAWFGVGRVRRPLNDENWNALVNLVSFLSETRSPSTSNKRHEYYRTSSEAWLESILKRNISLLDANLILSPIYNQFRSSNDKIDLLALRRDGRLVIIELKTQADREMVFQAADYWRKLELQRRRGVLAAADLFDGRTILDKPAIVYLAAPAWNFHRDFEFFARTLSPQIELWRFELHQNWREEIRVLARHKYSEPV